MDSRSDQQPLTRGRPTREAELATLIERHQAMVWRYLRALGADAALADDLTQDTFLEVIRKPFKQYSEAATRGYLRRVAHNLFISRCRRETRMVVTENAEAFEQAWTRWAGFDESGSAAIDALQECMEELSDRAKLALRMRFADNASRASIAQALGIGEHGAKNLMQRAKARLRDCVSKKLK